MHQALVLFTKYAAINAHFGSGKVGRSETSEGWKVGRLEGGKVGRWESRKVGKVSSSQKKEFPDFYTCYIPTFILLRAKLSIDIAKVITARLKACLSEILLDHIG